MIYQGMKLAVDYYYQIYRIISISKKGVNTNGKRNNANRRTNHRNDYNSSD